MAFNTEGAQIKCIATGGYTDPVAGTGYWSYNETRVVSEEQGSILSSIYDKFSRVSDSPAVMGIFDSYGGVSLILGSKNLRYFVTPSGDITGSTDRQAIQAAHDALPSNGGEIQLNAGVYYSGWH